MAATVPSVPVSVTVVPPQTPAAGSATVASGLTTAVPASPGSVLRHMMSTSAARPAATVAAPAPAAPAKEISINGTTFRCINATRTYRLNNAKARSDVYFLVDGGANGGFISETDARILETDLIATA